MPMISDMAAVAAECLRNPVCRIDPAVQKAVAKHSPATSARPNINPAFRLVFFTAFAGTVLFVLICVTVTIIAGKEMPAPLDKLIDGLFDLAKIGFGAIVGLLGGRTLREKS
jgi:hypothetical protein